MKNTWRAGLACMAVFLPLAATAQTPPTSTMPLVLPPSTPTIKPRVDPQRHVLAAGDVLEFILDMHRGAGNDIPKNFAVRVDGNVELPVVGELTVAGSRLPEIEKIISARLKKKLRNPKFRLGILSAAPVQVVVLGEVRTPGRYDIAPGSGIQEAIAVAGGFTPLADRRAVLVHDAGTGKTSAVTPPQSGEEQIALRNADVIYVLAGKKINVLGEVFTPGQYALSAETGSAEEALLAAGGAKPTAALQRAVIFRPSTSQSFPVKLSQPGQVKASSPPAGTPAAASAAATPANATAETPPPASPANATVENPGAPLPAATPPLWTDGGAQARMQEGDILIVPPRQAVVFSQTPKAIPLLGGETIMDVVTAAGLSSEVKLDDIRILRSGGTTIEHVNLRNYLEKQDRSVLVPVNDGDIVVVDVPDRSNPFGGAGFLMRMASAFLNPLTLLNFLR